MTWVDPIVQAQHKRVYAAKGKASQYNCVDCGKPAYDWSWIHNTDPNDVSNYEPRCRSCHLKYDPQRVLPCEIGCKCAKHLNSGRVGSRHNLAKLDEAKVAEIRELYATGRYKQVQLAEMYGVAQGQISSVVLRKTWSHI